ncbi:hypothetical protein SESBI_30495 [Sesbania bispinosa]|nr:hypothetical protein SESBI_30495 [Sesbania bispinosa]
MANSTGIEQISLQSEYGDGCDSDEGAFEYSSDPSQGEPWDEEMTEEWYDEDMEGSEHGEDEALHDEGTQELYDESMEAPKHVEADALHDEEEEWEEPHVEEFRNIDSFEDIKELDLSGWDHMS